MNQRLYFLLPDREHTLNLVNELIDQGFDSRQMHALAGKGLSVEGLPNSNIHQQSDFAGHLEFWGWRANLVLFFTAAIILLAMIALQAGWWLVLPLAVMVASFLAGEHFTHLPNTHLQEFRDALKHGEMLLMLDIPGNRVDEVEHRVRVHHPEAVAGGASWNAPVLGT